MLTSIKITLRLGYWLPVIIRLEGTILRTVLRR